jgi:predicted ferric reductase
LVAVGLSSARWLRRRLQHETWYFLHLYTYLAIALSFSHQLATGDDFVTHRVNRLFWVALYVATFGLLFIFRLVVPARDAWRYRLRVRSVEAEGNGVVSVYVGGRHLERMAAEAGQFFRWRFLTQEGWWHSHPFSLSAAPLGHVLRLTAKGVGRHSTELSQLRPGVRVIAEGPYGNLTAQRRTRQKVLLLAGGVGITPLRALLGAMPGEPGDIMLLYRVSDESEVLFRAELEELSRQRGVVVRYLVGQRDERPGPLSAPRLRHHVPDVAERDVYLCGPPGMMAEANKSLRSLGLRRSQIHRERFEL